MTHYMETNTMSTKCISAQCARLFMALFPLLNRSMGDIDAMLFCMCITAYGEASMVNSSELKNYFC